MYANVLNGLSMTVTTMTRLSALVLSGGGAKKLDPGMSQSTTSCICSVMYIITGGCMSSEELSDDVYLSMVCPEGTSKKFLHVSSSTHSHVTSHMVPVTLLVDKGGPVQYEHWPSSLQHACTTHLQQTTWIIHYNALCVTV